MAFSQSFRRISWTSEINACIAWPKKAANIVVQLIWVNLPWNSFNCAFGNLRWKIPQIYVASEYIKSHSRERDEVASQHVSRPLPTNSLNLWKYGAASHLKTHSAQYTQLQQIQKYILSHLFFATSDIEFVWQYGNIFGKSKYECVAAQQVVGSSFPWESLNGTSMGPLAKSWVVPSPENNS